MDVFDAVRTVLAVRQFKPDPIPDDALHRIVEAGRLTGSASNRQPWHFVAVTESDTIKELGRLVTTGPYIEAAPAAIVIATENSPWGLSDASRAIQSMLLTAWGEGIGSNWAGGPGMAQLKPLLGIPDELDVIAVLPLGYAAVPVGQGKKNRKSLGEVAHRERFGKPFE
jgi:nitroreductase